MPISKTIQPGDVGSMPPRPRLELHHNMPLAALTKKQLIALCEMRGVTHDGVKPVSKFQAKAYYVNRMRIAGKNTPVSEDELSQL